MSVICVHVVGSVHGGVRRVSVRSPPNNSYLVSDKPCNPLWCRVSCPPPVTTIFFKAVVQVIKAVVQVIKAGVQEIKAAVQEIKAAVQEIKAAVQEIKAVV